MNKIFLDDLPRRYGYGVHKNQLVIDWFKSVGYKVKFIYEGIEDDLEIIEYIKNRNEIKVKYNNKTHITKTCNFIRCQLGKIIGKITGDFKFKIGDIIKDNKRELKIIEQEYRQVKGKNYNKKWYKYTCNICNCENWNSEINLQSGNGCPVCSNYKTVKGINDIATTHSHLVKYFKDIEDAYNNTSGSIKKVMFKCTDCGYEKKIPIREVMLKGFSCPKCGDGISYPEKFMFSVLEQLLNNRFIYQYSKSTTKWCNKYRYDFYFEYDNEQYIIETHGQQHYTNTFGSIKSDKKINIKETQENDRTKKELALKNGIKEDNYIIIDCREVNIIKLKQNILNSRLSELFDLTKVNWEKCGEYACSSLVKEICSYWENKDSFETTTELCNIFNLGRPCIIKYLKIGNTFGWCDYSAKDEKDKRSKKCGNILKTKISKKVAIFKNGIILGIFDSGKELERQSKELFGVKLWQATISETCNGNKIHYKGYKFKYIEDFTPQEYIKYDIENKLKELHDRELVQAI